MQLQKKRDWKPVLLFAGLLVFFLAWELRPFYRDFRYGLDPSWQLGLSIAKAEGMQWGTDIVFTYGPLFWLFYSASVIDALVAGMPAGVFLLMALSFVVLVAATKAGLLLFFLPKSWGDRWGIAVFGSVAFIFISRFSRIGEFLLNAQVMLCILMFYHLFFKEQPENPTPASRAARLAACLYFGLVFAALGLIKFSYLAVSLVLLVMMAIRLVFIRKPGYLAVALASYAGSTLLLWAACGQALENFVPYLKNGLAIASGYTEAMSQTFQNMPPECFGDFVVMAVFVLCYGLLLLACLFKQRFATAFALFLPAPLLFLVYKESFVRVDSSHTYFFVWLVPLMAAYFIYVVRDHTLSPAAGPKTRRFVRRGVPCALLALLLLVLNLGMPTYPYNALPQILKQYEEYKTIPANKWRALTEEQVADYASYQELLPYIKEGEPVDIFPWEIGALYYHGLNWSPRPVIQSYSAYTAYLDGLNAAHYASGDGADKILYSTDAIDLRYFAFDEPATLRTLLATYEVEAALEDKILLARAREEQPELTEVFRRTVKAGEAIELPQQPGSYLFLEVNISPTLLGRAANFLYKTPQNQVVFKLTDGREVEHRFIRGPAENGLFVSGYMENATDLAKAFYGNLEQNIESITFEMSRWAFGDEFEVVLYEMPRET